MESAFAPAPQGGTEQSFPGPLVDVATPGTGATGEASHLQPEQHHFEPF